MTAPVSLELQAALRAEASAHDAAILRRFFKTGPGEYGEGDQFLGVRVPALRRMVRLCRDRARLDDAIDLLASKYHEARLLALLVMVELFRRGGHEARREIYRAYLARTTYINNWDLVDLSAPHIVGAWLLDRDRAPLFRLAASRVLWERRIAVLATFAFIRQGDLGSTFDLAERLMGDEEDLMHKAVGWMLREAGKRDPAALDRFIDRHAARLPRTMLRYAIEKYPAGRRRQILAQKRAV